MRALLLTLYLANLAGLVVGYALMPETVALHFGEGGVADGFGTRTEHCLIFFLIVTLMFAAFWWMEGLFRRTPPAWLSLPNKQYWLKPERQEEAIARMMPYMDEYGAAFFAFMLGVVILTTHANLSVPARLNEPVFLGLLIVYLVYNLIWCVRLFRAYRVPAEVTA